MTSSSKGVVPAIASIAIVGIGIGLQLPLLALALEERGLSQTLIGLITTMAGLATIIISPFTPGLIRVFGVRPALTGATILAAATLAAFPFLEPVWLWFPMRFLNGAALGVLFVTGEFWINAAAEERRRGLVMGIYGATLSLGFAAGPAILAAAGTTGSLPFLIGAGVISLGVLPVAFGGSAAPVIERTPPRGLLTFVAAAPAATLAAFFFGATESAAMTLMPLFGLRAGFGMNEAALLVTFLALGNVLFQIPLGLAADRIDRRLILFVCGAVGTVGSALLPAASVNFPLVAALLVIWGGVAAGLYTIGLTHLGSRFRGAALAQANAAFVTLYSLGMMVGPGAAGLAMDVAPFYGLPAALGGFFLIYAIVAAIRMSQTSSPQPTLP